MTLPRRPALPRRSRWPALAGLAVLVGALWSGLWLLAANRAGAAFDDWLAAEGRAGRQWTCPGRTIDGYPFRLRIGCAHPTFQGEIAGRVSSGLVEGLHAEATLRDPTVLEVVLAGPMNLRGDADEFDLMMSWSGLRLTVPLWPGAARQGRLQATRLAVTLSTRAQGAINFRAAHLSGEAAPTGEAGPADVAFGFAATGVSLPTVDDAIGGDATIEASGTGVLSQAGLLSAPTVRRLEAWRVAGGALRLTALTIGKGEIQGRFEGQVGLDADHRMAGRFDTQLSGIEPLAARFGIPLAGVKLGGLLTGLLGGRKAAPTVPGAIRLPLVLADGRVAIGPVETPLRLDPLY